MKLLVFAIVLVSSFAQAQIESMTQTRNGAIWIATSNGVYQITNDAPLRVADGAFHSLAADGDRVWAGSDQGLFHCEKQRCQHDSRMQTANVRFVLFNNQRLYAATDSQVFEILERKAIPLDVPSGKIESLAVDGSGTIWIASREWVGRFHDGTYEKALNDSAQALAEGPNGDIWIGSGFMIYHSSKGKITSMELSPPAANVRSTAPIKTLCVANDQTLWIGTRMGLLHWNGKQFEKTNPDVEITALFEDNSSVLWIGTARGLSKRISGKVVNVALPTEREN